MNKIGIFLPGKHGDMICATSALKYKDLLWPNKEIVWFCGETPMKDILKYNDAISEIRHWPQGWELPERCKVDGPLAVAQGLPNWADFSVLKTLDNRLDQKLKYDFDLTKDLEEGYFPTPWMMSNKQRSGIPYSVIPKKVFGIDQSLEWHPYLCFSNEERQIIKDFCSKLPHPKTITIENSYESDQSKWDDDLTIATMRVCRQKLGKCNFIFASGIDNSRFFDDVGVVSASHFTVRQCALINNYSDLFIGVSSGISVAVNCWNNKPTPKIEYTGSAICSTILLANGKTDLIEIDGKKNPKQDFLSKLELILCEI